MVLHRPEIAIELVAKAIWADCLRTGYFYACYEVDHQTMMAHDIGSEYRGGTVVEGTGDAESDINNEVLVVRYGHPTGNWDKDKPVACRWQGRKDAGL